MKKKRYPTVQKNHRTLRLTRGVGFAIVAVGAANLCSAGSFVWQTKAPNSLVRFEGVGGAAGGKLYQFSGFYTFSHLLVTAQCDAYDPGTDIWTRLTDMPQATTHCGQVADTDSPNNQTFWLVGGFIGNHPGPTTKQVWKYNIN